MLLGHPKMADFDDLSKLIVSAIGSDDAVCQPAEAEMDEKDIVRMLIAAKDRQIENIKNGIDEKGIVRMLIAAKTREIAKLKKEIKALPPGVEYVPCHFCKKTNHASSHCFYNPCNARYCKYCKKTNHVSAKCYFKPTTLS